MPVVGWICPGTRARVGWEHFDTCDHGPRKLTAYSPFLARLSAGKMQGDVRHSTLDITATGVMDCPRRIYLDRTVDYYVDPSRAAAMHRGTALHGVMAEWLDPEVWSTESSDPVRHDLRGELAGVAISALADAWRRDLTEIVDAKFPKDWSVKYRPRTGYYAKSDPKNVAYPIQLNIERHLMAQQKWATEAGYDPERVKLVIWNHGIGAVEGPLALECEHMTVEEIMAARAFDSRLTVADHAALLLQIRAEDEKIAPGDAEGRERLAAAIPLVGQPMFNAGKCGMCDLKEKCDELVRKFGAPA